MGEAFITRRGGGIPYAVIGVTYPSGSVCTCTSGTLTLTAKDTSGKVLFVIPYAGTWTVKAVKGSQSKSTAVKITTEGQVETVTLAYEFVLLNTSGWASKYAGKIDYSPSVVMTSGKGIVATYNQDGNNVCSQVVIGEVPNFSILQFTYSDVHMNASYPLRMGLHSVSTLSGYNVDIAAATAGNGSGTVEVDISQINTPCYLRITGIYSGVISEIRLR